MFILQNLSANTVTLTAAENSTLTGTNLNYLFRLIHDETDDEKIFIGIDKTGATVSDRYNYFEIKTTATTESQEILTASSININTGWGKYSIFEQTSNTNLKLSGTTKLLEVGKYYVSGITSQIFNAISYSSNTNNKIFYTPD